MQQVTLEVHPKFQIGTIDRRLFGGFLEHLGRAVYEGVYDPQSTLSDEAGLRKDVLSALEDLHLSCIRYPGGNFVSGYHWRNGVGPQKNRKPALDLAWKSLEPNTFGTDEFIAMCKKMRWQPMLTVNLGTGTPEEAKDWVEYCNATSGPNAELRKANGSLQPYNVPLWFLGNEMDAPWQLGHLPSELYAVKAEQAARMMKVVDPSIEVVIAGSCLPTMPTYMRWDQTILEYAGDVVDYIGFHNYVENPKSGIGDYLAFSKALDRQMYDMEAVSRFVQAKMKRPRPVSLCLDEWNVWYRNHDKDGQWSTGQPLLEEEYDFEDALIVAGFLVSFLRHANVLKIANIAQIVNVIAPIMTNSDGLLCQTIFWPFEMISKIAQGKTLDDVYQGPTYSSKYGEVNIIDRAVVLNDDNLSAIVINKNETETMQVRILLSKLSVQSVSHSEVLQSENPKTKNTFSHPNAVTSKPFNGYKIISENEIELLCPPLSLVTFTGNVGPI